MMNNKRSSSIPSSAAILDGNDYLLMEILLFLPAKSLVKFKLVSNRWRSLISSPHFSHLHTFRRHRRAENQQSFILSCESESQYFIFSPTIRRLVPYLSHLLMRILQSCNGLLLLRCGNTPDGHLPQDYCVYNPTTRQWRMLLKGKYWPGLCLFFDPSKSPHYKVVCSVNWEDDEHLLVYDSQTHTREKLQIRNQKPWLFSTGHIWNNCSYRFSTYGHSSCFDLDRGFRVIFVTYPKTSPSFRVSHYDMVSNGHMHYVVLSLFPNENSLTVYEMYNDESGWFLKNQADFNPVLAEFAGNSGRDICLLGMIRGDGEEDSMVVFHVPDNIIIYKFLDMIFEVIVDFRREDYFEEGKLQFALVKYFPFFLTHPFIESFAPV